MPPWLEIEDFLNPVLRKDVVVPSNSFFETQPLQQVAKLVKRNICVGRAAQDAGEKLVVPGHTESYTTSAPLCLTSELRGGPLVRRPL